MARIFLGFEELRDLLQGKDVTVGGPNHIILDAGGWKAMLTTFSEALALAGVQAAGENRDDWLIGDRLASVDRSVPIVSRIPPEEGAAVQLEAQRIVMVFLDTMMEKSTVGPRGMNQMPMPLPAMLDLMWLHGFSNGHDYCKEFGSMSELDMSFADMAEADLQKEEKDGDARGDQQPDQPN